MGNYRVRSPRELAPKEDKVIKAWKTHVKELAEDDDESAELAQQIYDDIETARLIAQEHFGKGSDRKPQVVLAIFRELSERRRDD